ncbi:GTP-binding protein [Aquimarina mytili]|uniref:GTP-binding protein n=1 Tax=Aquimarina mytili TaxID=874423 RepID=A0A936ZS58_9FLAO|nr:GTP-binding protein [Aquimarina mytili]MBL0683317.1 GTP-binding protein [Aquimarina mytili]
MEDTKKQLDKVRTFVGKAKLAEAIEELSTIVNIHQETNYKSTTLLISRLNRLKENQRLGIINQSEIATEFNRISNSILDIMYDIELEIHLENVKKDTKTELENIQEDRIEEIPKKENRTVDLDKKNKLIIENGQEDSNENDEIIIENLEKKLNYLTENNLQKFFNQKILLLGAFGVGKTSLVNQFVHGSFSEEYKTTLGVCIKKKKVVYNHSETTLIIWDMEGVIGAEELRQSYLRGAHGALIVTDLTRPDTVEVAQKIRKLLKGFLPNIQVLTIFNKSDKTPIIETSTMAHLASKGHRILLTSAKTGENVEDAFIYLTKLIHRLLVKFRKERIVKVKEKLEYRRNKKNTQNDH